MSKAAVRLALFVSVLLALFACSADRTQQASSSSALTTDTAAPSVENTGAVEQPQAPKAGNPGIQVASLPIGGNDVEGGPCAQVSWSGDPVPEGFGVEVSSAAFDPGAYQLVDQACPGPPCIGHVFRTSELQCDLAIRPTDSSATGRSDSEQVHVSMKGWALCPDPGSPSCRAFAEAVKKQSPSMTVALPTPPDAPPNSGGAGATTQPPATSTGPGG